MSSLIHKCLRFVKVPLSGASRAITHLLALAWLVVLGLSLAAPAQTAILMPMPYIQFSDVNGVPLAGGFVFTYAAGTSINQATFTDSTGSVSNTDPIVLNAGGEPSSPLGPGFAGGIYLTPGIGYRICVQDKNSVQQWCVDNVKLGSNAFPGSSSTTQVLFNCGGLVCGNAGLTFNAGTQTLSVTGLVVSAGGALNGTFTGSPTFSGSVTSATFISSCAPAASTGTIRFCKTDTLSWRNNANSADLALSLSGTDNLVWPNGLSLGGGTVLASTNQSGTGSICMTNNCQLVLPALNGVVISGTPSAGQVLAATSPTTASWSSTAIKTVISHTIALQPAGNIAVNAGVATTILTQAVTMPSAGCPCRALVSYQTFYLFNGAGGSSVNTWVNDGSVSFGTAQMASDASNRHPGLGASAYSEATYANLAVVTFTLKAETDVNNQLETPGGVAGGPQSTWMTIDIVTSN